MADAHPKKGRTAAPDPRGGRRMRIEEGARLSQAILHCANRGLTRTDFLREISVVLLDFCACDAIEVRLSEDNLHYRWEAARRPEKTERFELVRWTVGADGNVLPAFSEGPDLERVCGYVARQEVDSPRPGFTSNGTFWTLDTQQPLMLDQGPCGKSAPERIHIGGQYRSLILTRFFVDDETVGLLQIKNEQPNSFSDEEVEFCEEVAQALGLAVADRRAQVALRERIKELTCLYGIAQVAEQPALSLETILQRIVQLLPPGWQYPEHAAARIRLDGHSYATPGFRPSQHRQAADIAVGGLKRGVVEVVYVKESPELAGDMFLKEEERLISAVARQVALIVERKEAEEEKSRLQEQLIHADRLATIGQLAAGVAHELNEPLGSILGFAQLAKKCPDLPSPAGQDLEKIVTASLYAREVIKKLMVFARQMPPRKTELDLNEVVEDALYFLEAQCVKKDIRVVRELARDMPGVTADPAQLKQVLVNLVVNAVQAMHHGGTLTVGTRSSGSSVLLSVSDTGTGISEEILDKVFLPFFTTKDVHEGTGLGLAVVHGIVTAHGGSIHVESHPGQGARFEICLPIRGPEETQEAAQDGVRG